MSRSKAKDEYEDDTLDFDEGGDSIDEHNADTDFSAKLATSPNASRTRRNWRDVERVREEREMSRLLNPIDDWFSDLDAPTGGRGSRN